jgi:hypothetical protein
MLGMQRRILVSGSALASLLAVVACGSSDREFGDGKAGAAGSNSVAGAAAGGTSSAGSGGSMAAAGGPAAGAPAGGTGGSSAGAPSAGAAGTGGSTAGSGGASGGAAGAASKTTFFVTSDTSMTGKLGGLSGADARCQALAVKAGFGDHTFHAYLSAEHDVNDASKAVNARDRIGTGPWYNSAGVLLAADLTALHALLGNSALFLDEKGAKINGHWAASPEPVEHDVLTGSTADGKVLLGKTCSDWTSNGTTTAQVGHSDGLGPNAATTGTYTSWNSSHENGSCGDTAPKGGAGRLYCFAIK